MATARPPARRKIESQPDPLAAVMPLPGAVMRKLIRKNVVKIRTKLASGATISDVARRLRDSIDSPLSVRTWRSAISSLLNLSSNGARTARKR